MRDKTNTAISKQFCTSYFNFGFCSERLARLNSTACLQFLCSHHSTINPGRGYHNHHHQHFLWKVSSFLCTHPPFLNLLILKCVCVTYSTQHYHHPQIHKVHDTSHMCHTCHFQHWRMCYGFVNCLITQMKEGKCIRLAKLKPSYRINHIIYSDQNLLGIIKQNDYSIDWNYVTFNHELVLPSM
jgi:hypothetical protein